MLKKALFILSLAALLAGCRSDTDRSGSGASDSYGSSSSYSTNSGSQGTTPATNNPANP